MHLLLAGNNTVSILMCHGGNMHFTKCLLVVCVTITICCSCLCGRFLMQVLQLIMTELSGRSFHWLSGTSTAESSCHFLYQELSHLLLYITHMFQSGMIY